MKINPIQQSSTNFGANIVQTPALKEVVDYMSFHRMRPGQKDYTEHFYLWNKIEYAMLNHPSNLDIFTVVEKNMGDFGYAIGSIKTFVGEMAFKTRANQGFLRPVLSAWRDFLDPENMVRFNIIMGNRTKKEYKTWWNTFIAPHWKGINKYFGDDEPKILTLVRR